MMVATLANPGANISLVNPLSWLDSCTPREAVGSEAKEMERREGISVESESKRGFWVAMSVMML